MTLLDDRPPTKVRSPLRPSPSSTTRLVILGVLIVALMATLLARLADLQLRRGGDYVAAASDNRLRERVISPIRGSILDRNGVVLAGNRGAVDVAIDAGELRKARDDGAAALTLLARLSGTSADELILRTRPCGTAGAVRPPRCWNGNPAEPAVVLRDVTPTVAAAVMERRSDLPGVSTLLRTARDYPKPEGANAAHVLGYLSGATEKEVEAGRPPGDLVGRGGLEQQYDSLLVGAPGVERITVDRHGVVTRAESVTPASAGASVVTSIDAGLQRVVERELEAAMLRARSRVDRVTGRPYEADSGAAVVVDVTNGEILALASAPTFDPSVWVGGISAREYAKLTDEEAGSPLLSRAVQGLFAPASTFKVFTTAAALEQGYSSTATYPCPSNYRVGGTVFNNYESKGYGPITLRRSLEVSCDTVYYKLAHDMWKKDGGDTPKARPADAITTTAEGFGLGRRTGIDLPNEYAGRVGGREYKQELWEKRRETWCSRAAEGYPEVQDKERAVYLQALAEENCRDGQRYRAGDAINVAIGQGDTAITPLQLAMAYAAIGNGGTLWKPRVVTSITKPDGSPISANAPERTGSLGVKPSTLAYLQSILRSVTDNGTGGLAFRGFPLDKIPVASKTGTGEVDGKQTTSWFASYAPADKPKYAVVMAVSQGGSGARTAGPGVRGIYDAIFGVADGAVDPSRSVLGTRESKASP